MRLSSGALWSVPICLDIHDTLAGTLEAGQSAVLRDQEGFLLSVMTLADIWPVDREKEALAVYGTLDRTHPGADYLFNRSGAFYIGGTIQALNLPIHPDFRQIRLTPAEVKERFAKLGWQRIVGFQTRQPIHRPQFEMNIQAMQKARANLLLLPAADIPGPEDFDHYTRIRCYQKVGTHYPPNSHMLNLLPLAMRMAGPRDALLHMIIGKNFGYTHFVIGHNHASPGNDSSGNPFFPADHAEAVAAEAAAELGIEPVFFEEMVYLPFDDEFRLASEVNRAQETISFTGKDIRERIRRSIEQYGGFFEIHVSTPITECEKRDRKGIYAKARAGLLKAARNIWLEKDPRPDHRFHHISTDEVYGTLKPDDPPFSENTP